MQLTLQLDECGGQRDERLRQLLAGAHLPKRVRLRLPLLCLPLRHLQRLRQLLLGTALRLKSCMQLRNLQAKRKTPRGYVERALHADQHSGASWASSTTAEEQCCNGDIPTLRTHPSPLPSATVSPAPPLRT